MLQKQHIK